MLVLTWSHGSLESDLWTIARSDHSAAKLAAWKKREVKHTRTTYKASFREMALPFLRGRSTTLDREGEPPR